VSRQKFQPGATLDVLSGAEFQDYVKAANQRMSDFEDLMARGVKKPISPSEIVTVTNGVPFAVSAATAGPRDGYVWIGSSVSVYDFAFGAALKDIIAVCIEPSAGDIISGRTFLQYLYGPGTTPTGNGNVNLSTIKAIIRPGEHVMLRSLATATATGTQLQARLEVTEVPAALLWKALL
jgi:hypothetical protein